MTVTTGLGEVVMRPEDDGWMGREGVFLDVHVCGGMMQGGQWVSSQS